MTVVSIRCAAFTHLLETDLLLCMSGYDGPGPASPGGVSVTPSQTDRILSIPVRHLVLQSPAGSPARLDFADGLYGRHRDMTPDMVIYTRFFF
jgi:hypothetical protein